MAARSVTSLRQHAHAKTTGEAAGGFATAVAAPGGPIMIDTDPFAGVEDGRALARAIVDTIREPLLVLDKDLRVVAASRSFYLTFKIGRPDVEGRPVYALGAGRWNL